MDGSVWSFGSNQFGQLGNGLSAIAANSQPAKVVGMPPVASISAGNGYSTVIDVTGAVWAWGVNTSGQLGDSTTNLLPSPTLVRKSGLTTAVAAGTGATLALTSERCRRKSEMVWDPRVAPTSSPLEPLFS